MSESFVNKETVPPWSELLGALIRIPSVFEQEYAILAFVEKRLDQLGLTAARVRFDAEKLRNVPDAQPPFSAKTGRHNLVARIPGRSGGRSLVLNCHLDVVPAGPENAWTHPPFSGHIDKEKNLIYGRGAMDGKAGVAIALAVLETFASGSRELSGDLIVQFVLEDETTGNGTLLCLHAGHVGAAAIILDGTRGDRAINQHAGNMQFGISLTGKPASVSVSHMGVNAAEAMSELLLALRDDIFALNESRVEPWTRFPSPNQFVTQSIISTGRPLTVPDAAEALCYVTFTPPATVESMRIRIEERIRRFAAMRNIAIPTIQWDNLFSVDPVFSSAGLLEQTIQNALAVSGKTAIEFGPSTGTSDLRHFVGHGIPCVLFGPGPGYNPHRADEHYHLPGLSEMVALVLEVVQQWSK
jgi:acetylornithine deacetylase